MKYSLETLMKSLFPKNLPETRAKYERMLAVA
jgi:hypothetical protein